MKKAKTELERFPEPPTHLSARSAELWRTLGPIHASSAGRRESFRAALEALDRGDQCAAAIAAEGLTSKTSSTGAVHVHPLVKIELECRAQFTRLWAQLNINFESGIRRWLVDPA